MEEASYFKKFCIILRDEIERQKLIYKNGGGGNVFLFNVFDNMPDFIGNFNFDNSKIENPYGNNASHKILDCF